MQRTLIIMLVLVILLVILVIQNSSPVDVKLFFWAIQIPAALVILLSILFGMILGALSVVFSRRKSNGQK